MLDALSESREHETTQTCFVVRLLNIYPNDRAFKPMHPENSYTSSIHCDKKLGAVMTHAIKKSSVEDCVRIKDLGYGSSHHIRMYGQQFEIVSDPIPVGNGVSVQVTSAAEPAKRTLRLPTSILVGFKDFFPKVA
ncbi:MAG: hypothetical protein ABSG32_32270 [Terriglobia bacterium]